jgi:hypothetical protein
MKQKITIWMLLTGAVLLGGFIWFFERDSETSHQQNRRTGTVFAVYPDSIELLRFERDDAVIECVKAGGIWRLTKPAAAPVDASVVERMISGLARAGRGEIITAGTLRDRGLTPADYGFATPRARITFKNNRGSFTWLIGRDAPLGKMLYVMPEGGGDIIAAPDVLLHLIPQDSAWIRDRTLFAGEPAAVRGLDLRRAAGFLQLRQSANNGWLMQQPHAGRADLQAVHALIEKIFSAQISHFITDEKADLTAYGLEKPACELTIFTQDERTQSLQIGKEVPEQPGTRYARQSGSDSVFTVPSGWVEQLETDAGLLRSRRVLGAEPERITALQITRAKQQVELIKTNDQWLVTRPARWEAEPAAVGELIKALAGAAVERFADTPDEEETELIRTAPWELVLTAGGKPYTLRVSVPGTNGLRRVQCSGESSLYAVAPGIVRESFADPLFYRNLTVLEINPSQIEKISVRSGGVEQDVEKTPDGTFAAAPGETVNADALTGLIWTLNRLRAGRNEAFNPASLEAYGLTAPQTAVSVTLSGTNTIGHIVLLGAETGDGRFAMVQGQDIVFVLPEETVQALSCELTRPIDSGNKK